MDSPVEWVHGLRPLELWWVTVPASYVDKIDTGKMTEYTMHRHRISRTIVAEKIYKKWTKRRLYVTVSNDWQFNVIYYESSREILFHCWGSKMRNDTPTIALIGGESILFWNLMCWMHIPYFFWFFCGQFLSYFSFYAHRLHGTITTVKIILQSHFQKRSNSHGMQRKRRRQQQRYRTKANEINMTLYPSVHAQLSLVWGGVAASS